MDRIDEMNLDNDEGGLYIELSGDFSNAFDEYMRKESSHVFLRIDSMELMQFCKQVEKTDDYFYLRGRV